MVIKKQLHSIVKVFEHCEVVQRLMANSTKTLYNTIKCIICTDVVAEDSELLIPPCCLSVMVFCFTNMVLHAAPTVIIYMGRRPSVGIDKIC